MNKMQLLFRSLLLLIISSSVATQATAQAKENIFSKETAITWLGIDFSEARYLGDPGTVDPGEMKTLYPKINYLILSEPAKYNLARSFNKYNITNNLLPVEERNKNIDESKIISFNYADYNRMNPEFIKEMVKQYDLGTTTGTALVIIMEAMNKTSEKAAMWVTFINADTKNVILTARLTGGASGIGFRNHWAAPVASVLKQIYSKEFNKWKKSYGTKN